MYVLDDVLSAVDAHVGRYLFEECINKKLKERGKTVMLMTNQLQFLDRADSILILKEGKVLSQGPDNELKERGINFAQFIIKKKGHEEGEGKGGGSDAEHKGHSGDDQSTGANAKDLAGQDSTAGKRLLTEEEYETGSVPLKNYFAYLAALFNPLTFVLYFTWAIAAEGGTCFLQYWLGVVGSSDKISGMGYEMKIGMYAILAVSILYLQMVRAVLSGFAVKRSNRIIHNRLLNHVIHCPPAFFDTPPMGRILNRFTGDITQTDQML